MALSENLIKIFIYRWVVTIMTIVTILTITARFLNSTTIRDIKKTLYFKILIK